MSCRKRHKWEVSFLAADMGLKMLVFLKCRKCNEQITAEVIK